VIQVKIGGINLLYEVVNPTQDEMYPVYKPGTTVKQIGEAEGATLAVNFNFANNDVGDPIGRIIVNGKTVVSDGPKTLARDEMYMLPDGTWHIGKAPANAVHAWQSSPRILKDGKSYTAQSIKRDQLHSSAWAGKAYRLAGGIKSDGNSVLVRTLDKVDMDDLEMIMLHLGCVDALNGDGGGSAYMWPHDKGWGRLMGSTVVIKKGVKGMALIGDQKPELVIDPGHGGKDPGASGNGIIEKNMVLDISLYQYKRLKELGIRVAMTRDSDITVESNARSALVKNSGAKYCISNHINAAAPTAQGVETIHSIFNDGKLATALMQTISDAGQPKRSTPVFSRKNETGNNDYYFMHRQTGSVSTVIVEYGFCTNAADADRLKTNCKVYAEAVVKAYCQFVGHKYIPPASAAQPPVTPQPEQPKVVDGFTDIAGHWALESIVKASKAGVMNGVASDRFAPDQPVTRAQMAVILDRLGLLGKEVK